ncbi:MAG TPA: alpha/beta fold hydrolase [Devosia sp.]|nr:alpha/beta fold hydrolase [Devosia sp.]
MPFYDLNAADLPAYRSSVTPPADFDSFWSGTLEEARQFPLAATFEPYEAGLPLVDVFDVTFAGFGGHPIKGWYIRPAGMKRADRGAVVKFIGYNGGRGFPQEHLLWPASGRPVLVMDTRGQGSGWAPGDTPDPVGSEPAHAGFMTRGIASPKTYFYRRVFTDTTRAIEALRARAEIDPGRIATVGGSQGGALALVAASLDPTVKAVASDVPFLSDFPRAVGLAPRDPYGEVARYLAVHRDMVGTAFATLNYFDVVNHVRKAKASALFSVGLMDTICPPSTVYAAFNAYAGRKRIEAYSFNDHEGGGGFQERKQIAFMDEAL